MFFEFAAKMKKLNIFYLLFLFLLYVMNLTYVLMLYPTLTAQLNHR